MIVEELVSGWFNICSGFGDGSGLWCLYSFSCLLGVCVFIYLLVVFGHRNSLGLGLGST